MFNIVSHTDKVFIILSRTALLICAMCTMGLHGQKVKVEEFVDQCPTANGIFADVTQCDRYYECIDGKIHDRLCPDGLVFDEAESQFRVPKCSFPFSVSCADRPQLQPATNASLQCPRQHGYFAHENPSVCDQFYFCVDGVANKINCPESLVFNPSLGQCGFSDQVKRSGCTASDLYEFQCPLQTSEKERRHEHPRYPHSSDCQYFYICIEGVSARKNGCPEGQVFNPKSLACDEQQNVDPRSPCSTWYNQTYLDFLHGGTRTKTNNDRKHNLPQKVAVSGSNFNKQDGFGVNFSNNRQKFIVRRKQNPSRVEQGFPQQPNINHQTAGELFSGQQNQHNSISSETASKNAHETGINGFPRNTNRHLHRQRQPIAAVAVGAQNISPHTNANGNHRQNFAGERNDNHHQHKFSLSSEEDIQQFRDEISSRFRQSSRFDTDTTLDASQKVVVRDGKLDLLNGGHLIRRKPPVPFVAFNRVNSNLQLENNDQKVLQRSDERGASRFPSFASTEH